MHVGFLLGYAGGCFLGYFITDDPHAGQTAAIFFGLALATYCGKNASQVKD